MTREEARTFSYEQGNGDDTTVDEIYDDIDRRVCKNCKYYETKEYIQKYSDINPVSITRCSILWINRGVNFGCNEFEVKDGVYEC